MSGLGGVQVPRCNFHPLKRTMAATVTGAGENMAVSMLSQHLQAATDVERFRWAFY